MTEFGKKQSGKIPVHVETPLVVDNREEATILAALRFHQAENLQGTGIIQDLTVRDIASNYGHWETLDSDEIDQLCERINFGIKGSYSRQWRCHNCGDVVVCSYDDLVESGAPDRCSDCDSKMLIVEGWFRLT
jgi:hypothetical protein